MLYICATVTGFTRPSEVIDYARANRVALAFLDIEMGKTSGLELCRTLLEFNPRTNVIYLTAYSDYAVDAWSTGASGFILKPITPENQLLLGPFYPLMLAFLDAIMILNLSSAIRWRSRLSSRCYYAFLVGLLPIVIAMFIHFFIPVFELLVIGIVISAFSMFCIILSDQLDQNFRQQREIAHQRATHGFRQ